MTPNEKKAMTREEYKALREQYRWRPTFTRTNMVVDRLLVFICVWATLMTFLCLVIGFISWF